MPFWDVYSYLYSLSLTNLFPYRRLLEDLSSTLNIDEGEHLLDAGCGPGLAIEGIIELSKGRQITITGLDFSNRMIRSAQKRCKDFPNVKLQIGDLNRRLEFPDDFFDKVVCSNTLYTLAKPETAVSEFYRVLKRGGVAVIANPKPDANQGGLIREHIETLNGLTPFHRKIHHIVVSILLIPVHLVVMAINRVIVRKGRSGEYHFWAEGELTKILQEVGFKNIHISSCYANQDWLATAEK